MSKEFAIVLAGGKGTRLWPLSRENYPKQFIDFINGESLFKLTIRRLLKYFKSDNIIIVTSKDYEFHVINQIELTKNISKRTKRILKNNLILEPHPKSTAPAAMLALKSLGSRCKDDDIFFIFPSDHIIELSSRFQQALKKGKKLAEIGYLVIFGVKPKKPKLDYGYVLVDKKIEGGFKVKEFVEKPSLRNIKALLRKGAYWNAGIFCFKKKVFFEELRKYSTNIFNYSLKSLDMLLESFSKVPEDSIDYAIMQKTKKAALVEFDVNWSDLGNWASVLEYFSKGHGNFNIGRAEFLEAKDCFTFSKDKFISLLGVKDILIVEDSDSILVMKKGFSAKVKQLTSYLKKKKVSQVKDSLTVYRPWGYYTILKEKKNYKVKEIGVYPKKFISLQRHKFRSEHWNVVEGRAQIIIGNKKLEIKKNESIFVPKGKKHKVYNPTDKMLIIIEVQIGIRVTEDDIKRYASY